jgi:hypothetical protein
MKYLVAILCLSLASTASANAFVDGIKSKDVGKYLKNAAAMDQDAAVVDADGSAALQLRYDNELFAEFHAMPVKVGQVYTIGFRGKWTNKETLETNPTFETAIRETWETGLEAIPTMAVEYLDAGRKLLKFRSIAVMPYGQWKEYRWSFLPPPGAAYVVLKIKSGKNDGSFLVTSPNFTPQENSAGGIAMSFGSITADQCGKGFGFLIDGQVRTGLAVAAAARSDMIALGEGPHRLTVKSQPQAKPNNIALTFFDAEGKKVGDAAMPDPAKPLEFTAPARTAAVQLVVNNQWLDEIRIEPVR